MRPDRNLPSREPVAPSPSELPPAPVPVPHPKRVRDLLDTLVGRLVEVAPCDPVRPGRDALAVAVVVTDSLGTGAVVACDLDLTARLGGALGLVPVPQVEEAVLERRISRELRENFAEVANVLSAVFNGLEDTPHLTLHKVHGVGERLPADLRGMLGFVVRRMDLRVEIAGYGGGRLSLVAVG